MVTQPRRIPAVAFVALSFALIAFMTLRPTQAIVVTPTLCIFCGPLGGVDFILNVILFVPLGVSLRWTTGRWHTAVIVGVVATVVIETLQWRLITGRDASPGDLLANTLGTMVGAWLAVASLRVINASAVVARRLATIVGLLLAAFWVVSAALIQPVAPHWDQFIQWTPLRPNMDAFRGQLASVDLNDRSLRPFEGLPFPWVRENLTPEVSVRAVLRGPIPETQRQAVIIRIANSREEGFMLGQRRSDAVFRTHMRAVRLRLRSIVVRLDRGLEVPAGADRVIGNGTLVLSGTSTTKRLTLRREHAQGNAEVTLRRTIGLGWTLVFPWDVALDPSWWIANTAWLAGLVLPLTFLVMRSRRAATAGQRLLWWPLALALATLIGASSASGLSLPQAGEWLGIVVGIAGGAWLERWTAPGPETILNTAPVDYSSR